MVISKQMERISAIVDMAEKLGNKYYIRNTDTLLSGKFSGIRLTC